MAYHPLTKTIVDLLTTHKLWFETFEHEAVRTSEEAAKIRTGYLLSQGAKALIIRVKTSGEKFFVMLVIPGDKKFDAIKVKALLNSKDIRFATEAEVKEVTHGVELGGVLPFGNLFSLKVYSDAEVFANEKIVFNAGDRRFSIAMKSSDYKNLVKPEVKHIV